MARPTLHDVTSAQPKSARFVSRRLKYNITRPNPFFAASTRYRHRVKALSGSGQGSVKLRHHRVLRPCTSIPSLRRHDFFLAASVGLSPCGACLCANVDSSVVLIGAGRLCESPPPDHPMSSLALAKSPETNSEAKAAFRAAA